MALDTMTFPLSILMVSYNSREMTLEAIESAYKNTRTPFELICVDNDSQDGSASAIVEAHPEVKLIASKENLGFAGGNNLAAQNARGHRFLLLNPDTVVLDGAIDRLLEFADKHPKAGIWGGRTLFSDMSLNETSCWGNMTPWALFCRAVGLTWLFPKSNRFNPEAMGAWQRDTEREVDIVTGCFLLIDRDLWNRLGGFNPDFFMYGEEADLCHRAYKYGARPRFTPHSTIIHHGGGTEFSSSDKLVKTLKGKVTLMNVHWTPGQKMFGRWLFRLMVLVRAAGNLVLKPRTVRGMGLDGRTDTWIEAFRRRREWIDGWPISNDQKMPSN